MTVAGRPYLRPHTLLCVDRFGSISFIAACGDDLVVRHHRTSAFAHRCTQRFPSTSTAAWIPFKRDAPVEVYSLRSACLLCGDVGREKGASAMAGFCSMTRARLVTGGRSSLPPSFQFWPLNREEAPPGRRCFSVQYYTTAGMRACRSYTSTLYFFLFLRPFAM